MGWGALFQVTTARVARICWSEACDLNAIASSLSCRPGVSSSTLGWMVIMQSVIMFCIVSSHDAECVGTISQISTWLDDVFLWKST